MLTGLDRVTILVKDLERSVEQLERTLGLRFAPGGEQVEVGTISSIARFGTNYLELLSVNRPETAKEHDRGRRLLDMLKQQDVQILGFGIASDDLERDVAEARARGLSLEAPIHGSRRRPDGSILTWRAATVPNDPFGRLIPYLVQPTPGMLQRKIWEGYNSHHLQIDTISSIALVTTNLDAAIESYRSLLGEPPNTVEESFELSACKARYCIGSFRLELFQPMDPSSALGGILHRQGEGIFLIGLGVPNLENAVRFLRARGTSVSDPTPQRSAQLLDPSQTLGVGFQLEEVPR